ncbi:MAG: aromatic ring-hydroxylating dioxygenase subunit alpha [Candidatus Obscuribacterales bacterium]|jgi:phenylpropionate dioxygenase-like ring-hydroxylating dioxygenase large terminal subunit|nr:aromatic ring-hydroxylating dioxygenase subunit alpha [Candidatus Obscuribacterales bacterium]
MNTTLKTAGSSDRADDRDVSELESVSQSQVGGLGTWYLQNMWYFAVASSELKKGKMLPKTMLGEPILLGRDSNGKAFAMRDICPHQAVPLSKGCFDGKEVMCCFHGWKFDTSGTCTSIPSLTKEQDFPLCKIKTPNYPVREVRGAVWVYFGDQSDDLPDVPEAPGLGELLYEQTTTTLLLPTHIDYAALALIDPAHVPYVHNSWWWRSAKALKPKQKHYVPEGTGWTMVKHQPTKHSIFFKLFGQHIETEISFRLPGCRREYIQFAGKTILSGISTLTPVDETHTELNHTTYWMFPGTKFFMDPIIQYFVNEFLGQDQTIAKLQEGNLKLKPKLIPTIKDAGTPGAWYLRLKKEWAESRREGRPFNNPVPDSILHWMS